VVTVRNHGVSREAGKWSDVLSALCPEVIIVLPRGIGAPSAVLVKAAGVSNVSQSGDHA